MTNPLLKAALSYLREQRWAVIPINPKSKRPLVKWKEFQHRLPTEEEINGWWTRYPNAQVAVLTGRGSGLVVVDIDPRHGGDPTEWEPLYPTPLSSITRGGGRHFFYAHRGDQRVPNTAGKIGNGTDVRGDGGYVLIPPSRGYRWNGMGGPDVGKILPLFESPAAPRREVSEVSGEHWIEQTLRGVAHGERNSACARLAGYFVSKGNPVDVVVAQLQAWNRLNDPPLPESEVRTTVESVARTARDRPDGKHSVHTTLLADEEDSGGYDLISFSAYISKYGQQAVKWMVEGWLPTETVGMVVAPPGSYKTWLLQDLAISVATGLPYLGQFPVKRQGPVLFMQQEDYHGQIAHRFALIASTRAGIAKPRMVGETLLVQAPPKVPIQLHEHRRFRFDDEEIVQSWLDKIRRVHPALVVLDPLYSAGSVDDFMAGTARSMFLFKTIRDQLHTTFLIAHHTRKASRGSDGQGGKTRPENTPDREDVWGSQFLNAWIETGWQIRRREELGSATILRHFKIQSEAPRAVVSFFIDTTTINGKYDVAVKEVAPGEKEGAADLIRILEISVECSVAEMSKVTGTPRPTVQRHLDRLVREGKVVKQGSSYLLPERFNAEER